MITSVRKNMITITVLVEIVERSAVMRYTLRIMYNVSSSHGLANGISMASSRRTTPNGPPH